MFWKIKRKQTNNQPWSITNKLIGLYTITIFSIFVLIAIVFYLLLCNLFYTAGKQYLIDEVHVMKALLAEHSSDLTVLTQEVNAVPAALKNASYHYYVKILDRKNNVLMKTPNIEKLKLDHFPNLTNDWENNINFWHSPDDRYYLLITGPIDFDKAGNVTRIAQIAFDLTFQNKLINTYRNYIFLFGLVIILIAFFISISITKKGLKHLYEIAQVTDTITKPPFSKLKLIVTHWPRELKPITLAYNNMITRIENSFSRLSRSINELAHEFRTPINNLMGEAEVVLSKPRSMGEYQETISSSLEEYSRLATLIKNILFLARTDNPAMILRKKQMNVYIEIKKITDFFEFSANTKKITLEFVGRTNLLVDQSLFYRLIYNLLDNAIKYTNEHGEIRITIRESSPWLTIEISDNGVGIAENHLIDIFEPFYRIVDNNESQPSGLGLGLSIVKSIMTLHNGKVEVKSSVNIGTTFYLYFPLAQ